MQLGSEGEHPGQSHAGLRQIALEDQHHWCPRENIDCKLGFWSSLCSVINFKFHHDTINQHHLCFGHIFIHFPSNHSPSHYSFKPYSVFLTHVGIANMKSKIIASHRHFFVDVIILSLKYFKDIFKYIYIYIYMLYSLSLANCKQPRKHNRLYRLLLFAMFFFSVDIRSNQVRVDLSM